MCTDAEETGDDQLMNRVDAARGWINGKQGGEGVELFAFLSIFHPEIGDDTKREVVREKRKRDGR